MKKIKVGVIGAGQISDDHLSGIKLSEYAEAIAIADPSEKRAKAAAEKHELNKIYSSAEELLSNNDIDAVTIAVPNKFHAPIAIAALNAGKHVMLDKPFALNIKEAKSVIATAEKNKKIFGLGMNQRFTRNSQIIKKLTEGNILGEIYHGKACWFRRSGSPSFGTWFCRKDIAGGGAMLDIGVHMLDLCMYLMDNFKPVSVFGNTYTKLCNRGIGEGGWGISDKGEQIFDVDDFSTALIKFENGATVSLDASWALHQEENDKCNVQLYGTTGGATARPAAKLFRFSKEFCGDYESIEIENAVLRYPHCNRVVNWIDAIVGEDELCAKTEKILAVQKILDAIYISSETGSEVKIKDLD
jgi:predicted dehydrogenase